jgi:hypothetical protein
MGVTYKLKQEVIDFIVQKKKADPSLSCRKLVSLVHEAFQVEVSKSSINAVIKEFKLSNPVGRRSVQAPKNFFIPQEKKQELLAQVVPFLPVVIVQDAEPEPTPTPEAVLPPVLPSEEVLQPFLIKEEVGEPPIHLTADLLAKEQIDWSDEQGVVYENMGFFFVRALMQDVLRRPVLGRVLARAAGLEDQDAGCLEAAVLGKAMDLFPVGSAHNSAYSSLGAIFDTDPKRVEDLLGKFFGKNIPLTALSVALEIELGAALVEGAFFKFAADTGRNFYLSADLGVFLLGEGGGRGCSIFKAIEEAVDRCVTGRKPLVFDLPQGLNDPGQEFLTFLNGQARDRLDKIELWSETSDNLWNFTLKVGQRNRFIANIGHIVEYGNNISEISRFSAYQEMAFDGCYDLQECACVLDQAKDVKFRAIVVGKQDKEEKTVLLTNILEKELTKTQVLENYLNTKPIITNSLHNAPGKKADSHALMGGCLKDKIYDKNPDLHTIMGLVFQCFETYTAQVLFEDASAADLLRRIYAASARIRYQKNFVHVRFEVDKTFPYIVELQTAIDRANCFCIKDYLARRMCFILVFTPEK